MKAKKETLKIKIDRSKNPNIIIYKLRGGTEFRLEISKALSAALGALRLLYGDDAFRDFMESQTQRMLKYGAQEGIFEEALDKLRNFG